MLRKVTSQPERPRLFLNKTPEVIYVVGDIHGCYDLLARMEQRIEENAIRFTGEKRIILLGDYVDRGPRSADVIEHLLQPAPSGFTRHCLAGNHEQMMLSYLNEPTPDHAWIGLGGRETLCSYGINRISGRRSMRALLGARIPAAHIDFLRGLPSLISVPGYAFVHAGLRPGVPLVQQSDQDLLWMRPDEHSQVPPSTEFFTVHGHTPVPTVQVRPGRINIDTGAFKTGVLSCLRISRDGRLAYFEER